MVETTYPGIGDPLVAFEALRPYVAQLRNLQRRCKPFGRDYHALAVALESLESAAYHFTRQPNFYSASGKHQ